MKTLTFLVPLALLLASPFTAKAPPYEITWFAIAGGGGTSSGGSYTLSGTIGQSAAGQLTGGSYVLEGGFWAGAFAVQQVGSPTLLLERSALGDGNVTLSWAPEASGFVLQMTDDLSAPDWRNAPSGSQNPVTLPATANTRFYRLHHP